MANQLFSQDTYQRLVRSLRQQIVHGIDEINRFAERQRVVTYWNSGREIRSFLKNNALEHGATAAFYERLAEDLKTNPRTLQQCEQFHSLFSKKDLKKELTWSHYRYLFTVEDQNKRRQWIDRAVKNQWGSQEFRRQLLLQKKSLTLKTVSGNLCVPKRGRLFTYRLVPVSPDQGPADSSFMVDCGFANRIEAPPANSPLKNKYFYTSVKTDSGYRLKIASDIKAEQLFTFKADLVRVIDGDTLLVIIDQGFGVWTSQRLRLKGIDTPEMNTDAGRKAKAWVVKQLEKLPFLIVMTKKSDKYDRYLADVFYLKGEKDPQKAADEGVYLNQQLLDQGLAEVWSG